MRCPECLYELTESERLLCLVPDGHYCPRCWARITAATAVRGEDQPDLPKDRKPNRTPEGHK